MGYLLLILFVCFCVAMYFTIGRNLKVTLNTGHKVNPFLVIILPVVIFSLFYLNTEKLKITVYQHDKALLNSNNNQLKTVEGRVNNYHSESKEGHGNKEFTCRIPYFIILILKKAGQVITQPFGMAELYGKIFMLE